MSEFRAMNFEVMIWNDKVIAVISISSVYKAEAWPKLEAPNIRAIRML